jgi:starvation-inducible outer membrane lipoprotein
MKKYQKYTLFIMLSLLLTACGGSSNTPTQTETTQATTNSSTTVQQKVLSNMGTPVKQPFNGYELQVFSDKTLASDQETSQGTIAVYGSINGAETKSLLKINSNYRGSTISVKVYKDENLVAESNTIALNEQVALNFGEITTKQ